MKTLLENALGREENALVAAAEAIYGLSRDADGVFITDHIEQNIFNAGILCYPVYMDYETVCNKKAGYVDIANQIAVLADRVKTSYNTSDAAAFMMLSAKTLEVASPEIYEHFRKIQDVLKAVTDLLIEKENLVMSHFPEKKLKEIPTGCPKALKLAGEAILLACSRDFLLTEKYEALGSELAALK